MAKHKMEERTGSFDNYYISSMHEPVTFYTMIREPSNSSLKSPNGNSLAGKWILRNENTTEIVDFDQYRHDLAERNDIELLFGDEE